MNPDPDYSAAYVVLRTDAAPASRATASPSRSAAATRSASAAIEALRPRRRPRRSTRSSRDIGGVLAPAGVRSSQLRWLGPEKGVIHMATGGVVNAVWDLWAKREGKPLWKLLADLTPEQLVACVDFRYITDALTPDEALEILARQAADARDRERRAACATAIPAYTTSAGWLGYSDEQGPARCAARRCADGLVALQDEGRRATSTTTSARRGSIREEIGPDATADDRRQPGVGRRRGDRLRCGAWRGSTRAGSRSRPAPTTCSATPRSRRRSRPIGVATGEHAQNRVIFKQLLQAGRDRRLPDRRCRLGGVNEILAVLLLAAKFGVPVCPHAGGVGLCEFVQHLSMFDYVGVSGTLRGPGDRVRRPPARALRRPGRDPERALPGADGAGLQHRDHARVASDVSVSGRGSVEEEIGVTAGSRR